MALLEAELPEICHRKLAHENHRKLRKFFRKEFRLADLPPHQRTTSKTDETNLIMDLLEGNLAAGYKNWEAEKIGAREMRAADKHSKAEAEVTSKLGPEPGAQNGAPSPRKG